MIIINLLSPNHKEELKIRRILISVKEIITLVLLFTSIIAIMLVASRYFLENQLSQLIISNQSQIQKHNQINNEIAIINEKMLEITNVQKNFKKWTKLIVTIAQLSNTDIDFKLWHIAGAENKMEISGTAQSRDKLIEFRDKLEKSNMFEKIDLPLSGLLVKDKNNFTINTEIKKESIANELSN